jgi:hypothetical protein
MEADAANDIERAALGDRIQRVCRLREGPEAWLEILDLELQITNAAWHRAGLAEEAKELLSKQEAGTLAGEDQRRLRRLEGRYRDLREQMMQLMRWVEGLTGDKAFLGRHPFELWDIVD